jgi:hypothetical protein
MRTFDFYEFAGILVPGAVVFIAYGLTNPSVWPVLKERVFSAGDFGLFLITAYAAGHFQHALSDTDEPLVSRRNRAAPSHLQLSHIPVQRQC